MTDRVWGILVSSFVKILVPGIKVTIPLTITSFALSMVLGVLLAVAQNSKVKILDKIAQIYIWIFRGTPLIVQLFIIFFGLGSMGIIIPAFWAATLAFGLNLAAYNAETIRAAIEAIPKDQYEAASVSGLNYRQTMRHIILPQASRIWTVWSITILQLVVVDRMTHIRLMDVQVSVRTCRALSILRSSSSFSLMSPLCWVA